MARTILAEHRPRPIRAAREGKVVKIVGVVRQADAVLESPLTRRDVVATFRDAPQSLELSAARRHPLIVSDDPETFG